MVGGGEVICRVGVSFELSSRCGLDGSRTTLDGVPDTDRPPT